MKFVHPQIETVFSVDNGYVNELVIENRRLFRTVIEDISLQISGFSGQSVLSADNIPIEISKNAEIITQFVPFELNSKSLVSKIVQALEKKSVDADFFTATAEILQRTETYLDSLTQDFSCDLVYGKLNMNSILKSVGISVDDSTKSNLEKLFDYTELVREFDADKLFFLVNMRTFYSDNDMNEFIKTALGHSSRVFLLESRPYSLLDNVKRVTIDDELCEF